MILCLLYGIVKMTIDMIRDPNISASALLAFMSALIILLIGMLGDALAARLGRFNPQIVGVRTAAATLRKWENGEREPTGAARVLLTIISREPEAALRAIRQ